MPTEQVLFDSSLSVLYTVCKPAGRPGLSPPVAFFPDHYSTKRECVVGKRLENASRLYMDVIHLGLSWALDSSLSSSMHAYLPYT